MSCPSYPENRPSLASDDSYSDEEAARRRDELAKRILRMPPQPRKPSPSKLARAAAKPAKKKGGP